jgi:chlorophyll synthase
MTLNDFKSVDGDRRMGIGSLPARLGIEAAARLACWAMAVPQVVVIALLAYWGLPRYAAIVTALLTVQLVLMLSLLERPRALAPWYNGTGTTLYVLGMLACAFALRPAFG